MLTPIKEILCNLSDEDLDAIYTLLDGSPEGLIEFHAALEDELSDRGLIQVEEVA